MGWKVQVLPSLGELSNPASGSGAVLPVCILTDKDSQKLSKVLSSFFTFFILPSKFSHKWDIWAWTCTGILSVWILFVWRWYKSPKCFVCNINESAWSQSFSRKHPNISSVGNIHVIGFDITGQMLHLKASEGTDNNEIWLLLKYQKAIQTTRWTAALVYRVRKGSAQCNSLSPSSFSSKGIIQLLISIWGTRLLYLPSLNGTCVQADPRLQLTHTHQSTKSQIQSSALVCRRTHAQTQTGTLVKVDGCSHHSVSAFCVDGQFRWADFFKAVSNPFD